MTMQSARQILNFLLIITIISGCKPEPKPPFYEAIQQFREADKLNAPPKHAILFVGSSSFTMWEDVQDCFPGYIIINRAFGGSTLLDQIRYIDDVITPYSPSQVVIYCGENDLANSDTVSATIVLNRFEELFAGIRTSLPGSQISYVSMKPSPSRWHLADKMMAGNRAIHEFIESQPNAGFINIWDRMLDRNQFPDSALFLDDMLHMNASGYRIWQEEIQPALINSK